MTEIKSILCVDDETNILKAIKRVLRKEPYVVHTAQSGAEALEVLKRESIQVVLSDFRMPEMNGVELLKQIRAEKPKIVRAILSGYADEEAIQEALKTGVAVTFVLKPIKNHELLGLIERLCSLYPSNETS